MTSPRFVPSILLPVAVLFAACGGNETNQSPTLPPPQLRPLIGELNNTAKTLAQPTPAEQRELRELGDIALQLVESDARTASRAERALLDHAGAWWVLEPALADDKNIVVRRRAAWLCGRSQQPVLQLPLLLRLKYELDPETVVWVADALLRLGNDLGLSWLDAAIADAKTADQAGQLAIEALRARGVTLSAEPTWEEIRKHLQERFAAWRKTGVTSLPDAKLPDVKSGDRAQLDARLAAHLATTQDKPLRPIDDARYVLTRTGRLPLPLLQKALGADERYLRTMALQVLADIGPAAASAGPAVMPLLADPLTSSYAVRALGELGTTAAIPHLRPMLTSIDLDLRVAAAEALGVLHDDASVKVLRERLRDPEESMDMRVSAAFALRCFGDDAEAEAYLAEREAKKDYHPSMLQRLRERLAALRR